MEHAFNAVFTAHTTQLSYESAHWQLFIELSRCFLSLSSKWKCDPNSSDNPIRLHISAYRLFFHMHTRTISCYEHFMLNQKPIISLGSDVNGTYAEKTSGTMMIWIRKKNEKMRQRGSSIQQSSFSIGCACVHQWHSSYAQFQLNVMY